MYQGTKIGRGGFGGGRRRQQQVSNLKNPKQSMTAQRVQLDFVQELNQNALAAGGENPEIEGLISSYELAFRMQGELPKLMDLSKETAATLKLYGIDDGGRRWRRLPDGRPARRRRERLRPAVLARATIRRGRRAVRRDHARRLGPSPQPEGRADQQLHRDRQADRRACSPT